jgi:superfamily I DNA/RNA helicase
MTFHAFGLSIMRENCAAFGRTDDFSLVDRPEGERILSGIVGSKRDIRRAMDRIEACKQNRPLDEDREEILAAYEQALKKRNAFDLNDLIHLPVKLFHENSFLRLNYADRYTHVLVDEFQDINLRQYELMNLLASGPEANIFIIGDPDQAIYGFRGSDPRFMDEFALRYPAHEKIVLGRSYRCPQPVIAAASQALHKDRVMSGLQSDLKIQIRPFGSERAEADWMAATIEKLMGGVRSFSMDSGISDGQADREDVSFSDFAILCRSGFMFAPIVEALQNHGIAYQVIGTDPFYTEEPYRSALDLMQRVFYRRGFDDYDEDLVKKIVLCIDRGDGPADTATAAMKHLGAGEAEIKRLKSLAGRHESFGEFFRSLLLRSGADDMDYTFDAVSVMTIHASKGLEFRHVFIPGCEEGIIPFNLFGKNDCSEDMLEEERLFYVGIPRTMRHLFLTHSLKRSFRGRKFWLKRTHLLDRIEEDLLQRHEMTAHKREDDSQLVLF